MSQRRKSRQLAFQFLYQKEINGQEWELFRKHFLEEPDPFLESLIQGLEAHAISIDETITEASEKWKLHRMSNVDRNLLRLGVVEIVHMLDIPARVTINEAVELAKQYGAEESPAFVNGILDKIAKQQRKAQ